MRAFEVVCYGGRNVRSIKEEIDGGIQIREISWLQLKFIQDLVYNVRSGFIFAFADVSLVQVLAGV